MCVNSAISVLYPYWNLEGAIRTSGRGTKNTMVINFKLKKIMYTSVIEHQFDSIKTSKQREM